MAQKYTEARKEGNRKWDAANLDRLSIALPKGSRETIKAHATAQGESTNAFIKRAIDCQMERDGAEGPQKAAGTSVGAGGVCIPPDTLEAAQQAAELTGEAVEGFIVRAVDTQAQRDRTALRMGVNPATGEKVNQNNEESADHE